MSIKTTSHRIIVPLLSVLFCLCRSAQAQFELPNTDLWLLALDQGELSINQVPRAIAASPFYENQPSFSADGQTLFYTLGDGSGYTDIVMLSLHDMTTRTQFHTPLSEFSALAVPKQLATQSPQLGVVQVQADGSQYLVQLSQQSSDSETSSDWFPISPSSAVGYHRWLHDAAGVLGSIQFIVAEPTRLEYQGQLLRVKNAELTRLAPPLVIAHNVGRGLAVANQPGGSERLYFVQQSDSGNSIYTWTIDSASSQELIHLPERVEDFALSSNGDFWCGLGSRLYRWRPGERHWQLMADLQEFGIQNITRLAVQPQGQLIVFAASH